MQWRFSSILAIAAIYFLQTANKIQTFNGLTTDPQLINEPFKSYFDYFYTPEQAADPFVKDSFTLLLIYLQLIKLN